MSDRSYIPAAGRTAMIVIALAATLPGCVMPDYQLPSGFSSSYYRHLQAQQLAVQEIEAPVEVEQGGWWHWRGR